MILQAAMPESDNPLTIFDSHKFRFVRLTDF